MFNLSWSCGGSQATNCAAAAAVSHVRPYSQQGEDVSLVRNVFCDVCRHQRTYLELGALDGKKYSNTFYLELAYGWGGLLIEGLPQNAQKLIAHRGKSGRNVIFNEAICSTTGTVNFTNNPNMGTAGVMETMSESYLRSWSKRFTHGMVSVPCRPLGALVQLAGIREIDFFSLDVEGAELVVLQTFEWKIPVKVFCIELSGGSSRDRDDRLHALLVAHGYVHSRAFALGGNTMFIHNSLIGSLPERMRHCNLPANVRPCPQAELALPAGGEESTVTQEKGGRYVGRSTAP